MGTITHAAGAPVRAALAKVREASREAAFVPVGTEVPRTSPPSFQERKLASIAAQLEETSAAVRDAARAVDELPAEHQAPPFVLTLNPRHAGGVAQELEKGAEIVSGRSEWVRSMVDKGRMPAGDEFGFGTPWHAPMVRQLDRLESKLEYAARMYPQR